MRHRLTDHRGNNFGEITNRSIVVFCAFGENTFLVLNFSNHTMIQIFAAATPCFKKTSTHIIGYKLRNSCPILIIFDTKIPHII